jgi:uncharacterized protein HemX|tara:strand:- start:3447 stop:3722 length:276 start_codon:yes stop_codon:yes gene_type:complete
MKTAVTTIAAIGTLFVLLSTGVWHVYGIQSQVQQNSKAISMFILDRIDKELNYLKEKRQKNGYLDRRDQKQERELKREKKALECKLYKICK